MLENNDCNVSYIVLSFILIIIRCCLILCYLFMSAIIMFMGGIYYKLLNLFSLLFQNMYISSCIACLYAYSWKLSLISFESLKSPINQKHRPKQQGQFRSIFLSRIHARSHITLPKLILHYLYYGAYWSCGQNVGF